MLFCPQSSIHCHLFLFSGRVKANLLAQGRIFSVSSNCKAPVAPGIHLMTRKKTSLWLKMTPSSAVEGVWVLLTSITVCSTSPLFIIIQLLFFKPESKEVLKKKNTAENMSKGYRSQMKELQMANAGTI